MSTLPDLGPFSVLGGNFPFPIGPIGDIGQWLAGKFFEEGRELFGSGDQPNLPAPPQGPTPTTPDGEGAAHDRVDDLNAAIADIQQQLKDMHEAAGEAAADTGLNSEQGRSQHERILGEGSLLNSGLGLQGSVPEADAARLAAMQQQIDELTNNVADKATAADGIADSLRSLGSGIPGMGMGGGPGLGLPSLGGGLPGLSSPLGAAPGLDSPTISSPEDGALDPPEVSASDDHALAPPEIAGPDTPAAAAVAPPTSAPPAASSSSTPAEAGAAAAPEPDAATPANAKTITLPGGQVVTAPNPAAAAAVRNAVNNSAGSGDVATTAYAGTDVEIPTDGADPGRKVDPADVAPGDIALFDDHTALVAGNGQLVGPDGKLQPLGIINDSPGFKGFFRPTETEDLTSPPEVPAAPVEAADTADPTPATLAAAVPGGTKPPTADPDPGFGLSERPPTDHER